MPNPAKSQKGKGETAKQSKLFDYNLRGEVTQANKAMATQTENENEPTGNKADQILDKLNSMETKFSSRLDTVVVTLQEVKRDISDCNERMSHAEVRISDTEDELTSLQAKVTTLQAKNKIMEDKLQDLEARSRLNNLRLVNLPEGAEGGDTCAFLEKWIPEALGNDGLKSSVVLERAHRIARNKKDVYYEDQQVRFYPDLATGIAQLRKKFDPIRGELRKLGIRHGVAHPATLLVTYEGKTLSFKTPAEAQVFLRKIQEASNEAET
ncbi:hypothetical protein WMY93_002226 [Mugilogobius chulae]|uniref:L1 transposable element RRM domain-containing protein n=1 Tax=Mugilogobius chulae TaxID=88201 RepID=A0AAW0Q1I7_9GOBI